jgi:hypothetical protein
MNCLKILIASISLMFVACSGSNDSLEPTGPFYSQKITDKLGTSIFRFDITKILFVPSSGFYHLGYSKSEGESHPSWDQYGTVVVDNKDNIERVIRTMSEAFIPSVNEDKSARFKYWNVFYVDEEANYYSLG